MSGLGVYARLLIDPIMVDIEAEAAENPTFKDIFQSMLFNNRAVVCHNIDKVTMSVHPSDDLLELFYGIKGV